MARPRLDEDVRPLSEFRANAASFVDRVRTTKRPMVLTQRGHSAAVLLDVSEYEQLLESIDTLREIQVAEKQIAKGKGVAHAKAKARVLSSIRT